MDNLNKQIEEIETLEAIYGEEFKVEDEEKKEFSVVINCTSNHKLNIKLFFKFTKDYPSTLPPLFEIKAPYIKYLDKEQLQNALEEIYSSYKGENIIYHWIERLREELHSVSTKLEKEIDMKSTKHKLPEKNQEQSIIPEIVHGDVIRDRKSSFQAHVAIIHDSQQLSLVLNKLKENKKIRQAKHNVFAYRICNKNKILADCDDDGETAAGNRLLHLLELMDVKNVLVIVTRWYGGIHLGPDRFRHINNAAKQVLRSANLIPANGK